MNFKMLNRPALPYLLLLFTGLLAHGMLLLNDGKYVEGWFLEHLIRLGKWETVKDFWVLHGHPAHYWLQSLFGQASILTFRILSLAGILLTALFQYKILIRFTPLTEKQSLFLTSFALVWPFHHLLVWSIFAISIFFPVLFYAGWYGYLCLKEKKSHPLLYLPFLILIFLSFSSPPISDFQLRIYSYLRTQHSVLFNKFPARRIQKEII